MSSTTSTMDVLKWFAQHLGRYRTRVWMAIVALIVAAGLWLGLGQGLKLAVDRGLGDSDLSALNEATVLVVVLCVLGSLATYWRFYLMTWLGERVSADIRQQVFAHLLTLSPAFYTQTRTGEVISRFTSDTTVIQTVVGMSLSMAIRSLLTFVGALLLMVISSPLLTLCVLVAVPFILVPLRLLAPKVRLYARASQDRIADLGAHIDETLHEVRMVQAYTAESRMTAQFDQQVDAALEAAGQRIHYRSLLIVIMMIVCLLAMVAIAWLGGHQILSGELTTGELTAFLFYAVMAGGSLATISEVIGEIQRGVGASERLLELLNTPTEVVSGPAVLPTAAKEPPAIKFDTVTFGYPNNPLLFDPLDLSIEGGECVALVGPSGAGKSTIFQLLLRFYALNSGTIRLDSHNIADLTLESLRSNIALVPQEAVIFAGSVADNLRFGKPEATDEALIEAAKKAHALEFIERLPNGFDTLLGERGVTLSGGQRQRLAIARAFLADRPILLLDEATSALDAVSEQAIQQALQSLRVGRTTVIIAHRLATVQHADRILVVNNGRIVASGQHQILLEQSSLYRQYADLQLIS